MQLRDLWASLLGIVSFVSPWQLLQLCIQVQSAKGNLRHKRLVNFVGACLEIPNLFEAER